MDDVLTLFGVQHGPYIRKLQFKVIVLTLAVMFVMTTAFPKTYAFVVILLAFAMFIGNKYASIEVSTLKDVNKRTMHKLNVLQDITNKHVNKKIQRVSTFSKRPSIKSILFRSRLDCLYLDSSLIDFLHSIKQLAEYDLEGFYRLCRGVNTILCIRREMERANQDGIMLHNVAEMFEVALQIRASTLNIVHNFIYSTPKTNVMYNHLEAISDRFQLLISRNTDVIFRLYKQSQRSINTSTKFVSYDSTKPFDALQNHPTQPHKGSHSLIPFYI